jgi:hypothetical protein
MNVPRPGRPTSFRLAWRRFRLAVLLGVLACAAVSGLRAAPPSPAIGLSADGQGFALQPWGRPFTPWGFNYDHDQAGQLLEDYWEQDWRRVEEDFREMQELGASVVRIHLQFGRFMQSPNRSNAAALERLRRLLGLAARSGLRLNLTGLGCYDKAAVPPWYDALPEKERWQAQAAFWEAVAQTCASHAAVFCYNLMNEPVVAGAPRAAGDWLGPPFAGKHFVQFITLDPAGRDRAAIATDWIRTLSAAIRKHDRRTLITVGLVDWSLDRPGLQSGFIPARIAPHLDFLSVHLYPKDGQLASDLATLRGFAANKPVVVEETFPLSAPMPELARFIELSRPVAAGWLGFYWGQSLPELRRSNDLGSALTRAWLEYFQAHPQPVFPGHQTRRLEGWTVFVSDQLLSTQAPATETGLALLAEQLRVLRKLLPADPLGHLQTVPIWISPEYKGVRPTAEYHPGAGWLRDHGRNPAMAGAVEFTNVRSLPDEVKRMPMLVLHELAHAYHDQVLGYDDQAIREAAKRARANGRYDRVKRVFADGSSKLDRAYALTNPQEYFAECTEAFFGRNDFYPFTREELRQEDPEMHQLLQHIWLGE